MVVFSSARTGKGDLYKMSVRSGATKRLTSGADREQHPAWSWDNSRIAYDRGKDIWSVRSDGSGPRNETPGTPASKEEFPFWLPDGRLGFTSDVSGAEHLYVLQRGAWKPLRLAGRKGRVSADGKRICYTRELEVYWSPLSSPDEHNVSHWEGSDHNCAWDPWNSFFLLIHSHRRFAGDQTGRIWRVDRSGTVYRPPLTAGADNSEGDNSPTWHPTGWIAWVRFVHCAERKPCGEQYDRTELFAMDPRGEVRRYTVNGVEDNFPDFRH